VSRPAWAGLPLREELRQASPYGAPQLDLPVRLNVNENPYPPSDQARQDMVAAVTEVSAELNRYPDREAWALRGKLAAYLGHGLDPTRVWAANGSNEIMVQILQAFGGPGHTVLNFTPSYSMYPQYARDTYTAYRTEPRDDAFQIDPATAPAVIARLRPEVVVIANPNTPTGTLTPPSVVEAILQASPGVVVVDEAYQEFTGAASSLELLDAYPRLLVARTMSKAFAFAGGRLGYLAASPAVVDALRVVRLPYHLSALTQAVAGAALDHADTMLAQVDHLRRTRDQALTRLRAMGLTVVDSAANFFLFGPFADRHAAWQGLVDQGVLVRETGPEPFLRACVGTDQEMDRFYAALDIVWGTERTLT
jgi:histidinol-phosphate aminotransferase